jgi:hypothetical protein
MPVVRCMPSADETRPRRPERLAPCPAGAHPDGCEALWRRDEVPEAAELRAYSVRRVREGHDKERRVLHAAELGCERGGVGPHERRERCGVERSEDVVRAQGLPARAERSRASAMGPGGERRSHSVTGAIRTSPPSSSTSAPAPPPRTAAARAPKRTSAPRAATLRPAPARFSAPPRGATPRRVRGPKTGHASHQTSKPRWTFGHWCHSVTGAFDGIVLRCGPGRGGAHRAPRASGRVCSPCRNEYTDAPPRRARAAATPGSARARGRSAAPRASFKAPSRIEPCLRREARRGS